MQILSALDAISPAFSRTKLVLFTPFRKGRTWKLAASAYLTILGTMFLPYPLIAFYFVPLARASGGRVGMEILVGIVTAVSLIYVGVFYLCSRLQFAYFDIVLNRGEFVAPAWRKYRGQSFKWATFKIVLGTLVIAAVAAPITIYIKHLIARVAALQVQPGQDPSAMMSAIFTGYAAVLLVYLMLGLFYWCSSLLGDFIIPSLALEDTTIAVAFGRLAKLIRREPGQFFLFALLKLGIAITGYIAQMVVFYIVLFVVVIVFGLLGFILGMLLHAAGVPMAILEVAGMIIAIPVYILTILYGVFLGIGTMLTFLESYALYFLGGRYLMIGERLERSTPVVTLPEPVYPPYLPEGPTAG